MSPSSEVSQFAICALRLQRGCASPAAARVGIPAGLPGSGRLRDDGSRSQSPASDPAARARRARWGAPAGTEIVILGAAGQPLPPGQRGEVAVRGPNVVTDDWLRTGDSGYLNPEGDLFLLGRLQELIDRGGEKISPREVERVLLEHPEVLQAAVWPSPHPILGQQVGCSIALRRPEAASPQMADRLRTFGALHLQASQIPQEIIFLDAIPHTATGKVDRAGLELSPAEQALAQIWAEVLDGAAPSGPDNFFELGGHSLSAARVLSRIQRRFGVQLSLASFFQGPTLAGQARRIGAELANLAARRVLFRR